MNKTCFRLAVLLCALGAHVDLAGADNARVIRQSTSSDCGPAALATLLTFYLDVPASEREMMRLANSNPETGTSLRGLESAAIAKGCEADSFRMDFATLQNQLQQFGAPVVVRMLNPEPHFAVVIDAGNHEVGLADPAAGNILLSRKAFLARWLITGDKDGYVFIAAAPDGHINAAHVAATRRDLARTRRALQTTRAPLISAFR